MASDSNRDSSPLDVTIEASSSAADSSASHCAVHLAEGSSNGATGEMRSLLRSRLRVSAQLLFAAFAMFLVWHTTQVRFDSFGYSIVYIAHVATTLIVGIVALLLTLRQPMCLTTLRIAEAVLFGLPLVLFMLLQHFRTVRVVETFHTHPGLAATWLLLVFTYALYIPNTWRRAAIVIGLMAAMPIATTIFTAAIHPQSGSVLVAEMQGLVEIVLVMIVSAVSAVIGVHTINTLRSEALKAKQLGQYKLKQLIGQGGMGDVYLAEHQLMKRPCAIKVIRPEKAGDQRVLARFEREVQSTAKLSHWNSIDIFDYGRSDDGTFYYVMEYLPGMNLAELVRRYGPLPPCRAIHLVRQACDALQEAHQMGLIHRDLKPANIFSASRGGLYDVAKLLDFGLVKPLANFDATPLTQDGSITGSPLYMSPEQAAGDGEPDARSDIYSMGAVLYFVLTGRPPFENDKPLKVLISHASEPPQPPSIHNPSVPDDLEMVVLRCLQKGAGDRYQTASDLAAALDMCEETGKWTRDEATRWWQQHEARSERMVELAID